MRKPSQLTEEDRRYHLDRLSALGLEMKAERRLLGMDPDKGPCPFCGAKPAGPRRLDSVRDPPDDDRMPA